MIKIAQTDMWREINNYFFFSPYLKQLGVEYEIVTDIQKADYLFYSVFGVNHVNAPEKCVKIFFTGECLIPDFNECDYAIGFDYINFGDRYLRCPLYYFYGDAEQMMEKKHILSSDFSIAKDKPKFCSFTVSNAGGAPIRKELFEKLSTYKTVDSGGRWMNNVGGPVKDKFLFDSEHKFSIVCENVAYPGYTTEKIVQAFAAHTIPIYWGDPMIKNVFNPKAFIDVTDYGSLDEVLDVVKAIDTNDELYMKYLREPALVSNEYKWENQEVKLLAFLKNIFSQDLLSAKRMCTGQHSVKYRNTLRQLIKVDEEQRSLKKHIVDRIKDKLL